MDNEQIKTKVKESFLTRWKKGIEMITPLHNYLFVGLIAGMIVMLWKLKDFWWIELILGASLFNQSLTMIGIWQKIKMIKKLEEVA